MNEVQIAISIISCLINTQIAIFRQDKWVPSCFASFWLDCFILFLTEKVILWVVLANRVLQKWPITSTNVTQSSFSLTKGPILPGLTEASHIYTMKTSSSFRSTYIYIPLQAFHDLEYNTLLCSPSSMKCTSDPRYYTGRARSSHYAKYWIFNRSLQSDIFRQRFHPCKQVEEGSVRSPSARAKNISTDSHLYPVCQMKKETIGDKSSRLPYQS